MTDSLTHPGFMYRHLANGEVERVPIEANMSQDEMWEAQQRQRERSLGNAGVAGANGCTYCGQTFNSAGILNDHINMFHMVQAGKIDMRAVELPDGTSVPVGAVPEMLDGKTKLLEEAAITVDVLRRQLAASQEREKELEAQVSGFDPESDEATNETE